MSGSPYSDSWVYEGIVGALPGIAVSPRMALVMQFLLFESAVVLVGFAYDLPEAAVAGTVAVGVVTVGSAELVHIGDRVREIPVPESYRCLLFGSNIEVVLSVLAYIALVTHLFVFDPATRRTLRRIDGEVALFGLALAELSLVTALVGHVPADEHRRQRRLPVGSQFRQHFVAERLRHTAVDKRVVAELLGCGVVAHHDAVVLVKDDNRVVHRVDDALARDWNRVEQPESGRTDG